MSDKNKLGDQMAPIKKGAYMSDNKWGMIGFLFILFSYIIFVILLHLYDNGHREKFDEIFSKIRNKFKIYYLIPILIFLFIVISYAIVVTYDPKDSTSASLGQLGDFFGGILNPIFGFITIIFLWVTLQKEIDKNNKERAVREKNELIICLERALTQFEKEINLSQFPDNGTLVSFIDRYIDEKGDPTKNQQEFKYSWTIATDVLYGRIPPNPTLSSTFRPDIPENRTINPMGRIVLAANNVIEMYVSSIDITENKAVRQVLTTEYLNWLRFKTGWGLFSQEKFRELAQKIEDIVHRR